MAAQPDLFVTYRGLERPLRWGSPRFEFGARTPTGLVIGTASRQRNRYLHGVCGWFECVGGWAIERRVSTGNIDMHVRTGAIDTPLAPGAPLTLQRGPGLLVITMQDDPGVTIEIEWDLRLTPDRRRPPILGGTLPVERSAPRPASGVIAVSPFQRDVMRQVVRWPGPGRVTHKDVAEALDVDVTRVRKAIERLTAKIRRVDATALPQARGVGSAEAIARWLVERGLIEPPPGRPPT